MKNSKCGIWEWDLMKETKAQSGTLQNCCGLPGRGSHGCPKGRRKVVHKLCSPALLPLQRLPKVAQTIADISRVICSDAFFTTLAWDAKKFHQQRAPQVNGRGESCVPSETFLHGASHRRALKSAATFPFLNRAEVFKQTSGTGILNSYPRLGFMTFNKIDNPKRICGNFAELPHPVMPGAMLYCWRTPEMGFAMVNWALPIPAGNYFIPITDTDSIAPGNCSFWAGSYGRELQVPISKGSSGLVCSSRSLSAASLPPSAQSPPGKPEGWIHWTLPVLLSLLLECLSSHWVKRKLQKFLVLEPEENNHRESHFCHCLVVKPLTFWPRLSTACGSKQVWMWKCWFMCSPLMSSPIKLSSEQNICERIFVLRSVKEHKKEVIFFSFPMCEGNRSQAPLLFW